MFALDPAFSTTSAHLRTLELCQARLQLDARFAWLVLIPQIPGARELDDLTAAQGMRLLGDVAAACKAVRAIGEALGRPVEKLNVATLGNVTPQLHVHIVGRRTDDAAWPAPVWGRGPSSAYSPAALESARAAALSALAGTPRRRRTA
jgi:diadenosine tetraphosphate (Ap4A) HIT family hydrolase